MEMIIGGAFQGKSSLAESKYPDIRWVKGAEAAKQKEFWDSMNISEKN